MVSLGLLPGASGREVAPRCATREELEWFHSPAYLDQMQRAAAGDLTIEGLGMGFCYLNDVGLGCRRLADAGRRVLFLDVDAHHGDGT